MEARPILVDAISRYLRTSLIWFLMPFSKINMADPPYVSGTILIDVEDRFLEMSEIDLAYAMQNFQELLKDHFGINREHTTNS